MPTASPGEIGSLFFRTREKLVKKRLVSFGSNTINSSMPITRVCQRDERKIEKKEKMEWISNRVGPFARDRSNHKTRLIFARSSFSRIVHSDTLTRSSMLISYREPRDFSSSNTTVSRSYRERKREKERGGKHLHPAVTSVYVTSVTREQAPHGCGTQWWIFEGCVAVCPPSRRGATLSNLD